MTRSKNTKRAFFTSVVSLVLCISMFVGSTFAWFTDTASTGVNKIQSGNLDVMLEMSYDDGATWQDAEGEVLNFTDVNGNSNILWEPGAEFKLPQLRIKNNGNLALKFKVVVNGLTGDMILADVLDVKVNGVEKGTLTEVMALNAAEVDGMIHGELAATKTSDVYEVSLKMQEGADNDYMNKTLSGLCITVYATQDAVEWDSWTQDYDAGATYSDEATIKDGVPVVLHSANATVSIPADTLTAGQVVKVKEQKTDAPDNVVTLDDTLISATDISIVDADGNEVAMPDGTYTVTMNIGKGLDKSKLALYHKSEPITEFNYDATSGIISFTTKSFSPFTVKYAGIGTIDSAEKLVAVRDSINAGNNKAGVVYNLTTDIDLKDVKWTAINNFAGTFDGQGHTISNMTANLFGTVSGTVKNLNVENVNVLNTGYNGKNGFIASVANGGLVDNCKVSGVKIEWADTVTDCGDGFGGVISGVSAGATVQNCEFTDISMTTHGKTKRMGGVFSSIAGTVKDCNFADVNFTVSVQNGSNAYVTSHCGGFASSVETGAVVDNCKINNMQVNVYRGGHLGGIFGKAYGATLKDITVNGLTMNVGDTAKSITCIAGFIAQPDTRSNDVRAKIDNCHIYGLDMTLASSKQGESAAAGFISGLCGGVDVTNCSVSGKIDGTNTPANIGGFIGDAGWYGAFEQNFTDCSTNVNITVNNSIGGGFIAVDGTLNNTAATLNFSNCQATGTVTVVDGGTGTASEFCGKTIE